MATAGHWSRPDIELKSLAAAHAALRDESLLDTYFERASELLCLIQANSSTASFDTSLAWSAVRAATVPVLVYGESGSGKSTLVRALTSDRSVVTSATGVGTISENCVRTPSGVSFTDTPGFRVPLSSSGELSGEDIGATADGGAGAPSWWSVSWFKEVFVWRKMLWDLGTRLRSANAAVRPLALLYVHKAGTRIVPSRIAELLRLPHDQLVPVFLVMSDVCSVDDRELEQVRAALAAVVDAVGANGRGRRVQLVEVNSVSKRIRGHLHSQSGLRELVSAVLSSLDPIDVLTFTASTLRGAVFGPQQGGGGAAAGAAAAATAAADAGAARGQGGQRAHKRRRRN
eukprot:g2365.t1